MFVVHADEPSTRARVSVCVCVRTCVFHICGLLESFIDTMVNTNIKPQRLP